MMPALAQFSTVCGSTFSTAASSSAVTMSAALSDGSDGDVAMVSRSGCYPILREKGSSALAPPV
jgi:hypothetical protein